MLLAARSLRVPLRVRGRTRHAHNISWRPSFPARPQPANAGEVLGEAAVRYYSWSDWFVGSVVASFVAWPVVFATDVVWGDMLLPKVDASGVHPEGAVAITAMLSSLVPKVAGSYLGAHLYCALSHLTVELEASSSRRTLTVDRSLPPSQCRTRGGSGS
jgi:hypothetical protein